MTTNTARPDGSDTGTSPTVLPIDLPYRSRLSWELGVRVVEDLNADRLCRWKGDGGWSIAVFHATNETVIVRFRTPIGRELFYGVASAGRSTIRSRLDSAPTWRRID